MPPGSELKRIAVMVAFKKMPSTSVSEDLQQHGWGRQTSAKAFYTGTMDDYKATLAVGLSPTNRAVKIVLLQGPSDGSG